MKIAGYQTAILSILHDVFDRFKRYIFILLGASKFAYTLFLFAATTALTPMNKEIQDMSASV